MTWSTGKKLPMFGACGRFDIDQFTVAGDDAGVRWKVIGEITIRGDAEGECAGVIIGAAVVSDVGLKGKDSRGLRNGQLRVEDLPEKHKDGRGGTDAEGEQEDG